MKTSLLMGPSKDRFSVDCSDKANLSEQVSVTFSVISAEMARVQAKLEFDLEVQEMEYHGNIKIIDPAGLKLKVDNNLLRKGSRIKLFKSLNLIFLTKLFYMLISLCFSTSGVEDF